MKCFVTGATGFIGGNLVHELNHSGHSVRALVREKSDLRGLKGAEYEPFHGDIADPDAMIRGLRGCDWCFHVAANYNLWLPDYAPMYQSNVEGTRNVLSAAQQAGCSRIVYTSTVGCIGLPRQGEGKTNPTDETTPVSESQMSNHYKRSKWKAERVAIEMAEQGLPVVIVNPTAPIGPRDVKPTPTGQFIRDFLNDRMPAYLNTGLNWVHVKDVARGHVLAAELGRIGERYILGSKDGNLSMREALEVLATLSGKSPPRFQIPYGIALAAALFDEGISRISGKPPRAPLAGVKMAKYQMYFNPAKAIRELGLPQTQPVTAFQDAITWFAQNGYLI